ncbi:MAG: Gfo/Idh/MocA family oxidoreductase [Gemmatimonadota bacterium]
MPDPSPARLALVGCGGFARHHLRQMLRLPVPPRVRWLCEPSPAAVAATARLFSDAGLPVPPNQPDLGRLLADGAGELDAALVVTPHAAHCEQGVACLEAGLDVLMEKPMTLSVAEAERLIAARDRTGRALMVAFPASLSPRLRAAVALRQCGELGDLVGISASLWENWAATYAGTWRHEPALSGGGFLFDTGAHLTNTVFELAGEEFVEVAAHLDGRGRPVDTRAAIVARTASGALATLFTCGEAAASASARIHAFYTGADLHTDAWASQVQIQRRGESAPRPLEAPDPPCAWAQFEAVRAGRMANPGPAESGLRVVRLWEAAVESARRGGAPVAVGGS